MHITIGGIHVHADPLGVQGGRPATAAGPAEQPPVEPAVADVGVVVERAVVVAVLAVEPAAGGQVFGGEVPEVPLPDWVSGIRLLGPVSLESLLTGLYDGLRLATIVVCVGAANALANPRKLLASMPGALYEVGTVKDVKLLPDQDLLLAPYSHRTLPLPCL